MEIDIKNIKAAYETATESEETLLSDLSLGQTREKPVTERIKTFEDARHALGESHLFVVEWRMADNLSLDLEAYLKLRIICAALNEGWEPKFDEDEFRYFPWFFLYTKEEYKDFDENDKKKSRVVVRSYINANSFGGVSYASSSSSSYVSTDVGFRLA